MNLVVTTRLLRQDSKKKGLPFASDRLKLNPDALASCAWHEHLTQHSTLVCIVACSATAAVQYLPMAGGKFVKNCFVLGSFFLLFPKIPLLPPKRRLAIEEQGGFQPYIVGALFSTGAKHGKGSVFLEKRNECKTTSQRSLLLKYVEVRFISG